MAYQNPQERADWMRARRLETRLGAQLRRLAKHVSDIMRGLSDQPGAIEQALARYADAIRPWAESVTSRILREVDLRDEQAWKQHTKRMSKALRNEILRAPTGSTLARLQSEQVALITSLPLDAAQKVHQMSVEGLFSGARATERISRIQELGDITRNRAKLIARTETSRAASNLTQARAEFVGSKGYIWRTSEDSDVRPTHKKVNGRFILWTEPPKTDPGLAPYHAGCGPNCRCYPEPVIPEHFD